MTLSMHTGRLHLNVVTLLLLLATATSAGDADATGDATDATSSRSFLNTVGLFTRPTVHDAIIPFNLSGPMSGSFQGSSSISANLRVLNYTLPGCCRSFGVVGGEEVKNTVLIDPGVDTVHPGVAVLHFASGGEDRFAVRGTAALRRGEKLRRYTLRGGFYNESHTRTQRFSFVLTPTHLDHLLQGSFLAPHRAIHSFLAASFSVLKFKSNQTLWVNGSSLYPMPSEEMVRRDPHHNERLWSTTSYALDVDACIWYGDLEVLRGVKLGALGVPFALEGELVSLTCNRTLTMEVSHASVVETMDGLQTTLSIGLVLAFLHTSALASQARYSSTRSTQARLSWISFMNLGISEWGLFSAHWVLIQALPKMGRLVMGVCVFNGMSIHFCLQHTLVALEAAPNAVSYMPSMIAPALLTFPINILLWVADNRVQYLWICSLLVINTIWAPQIWHTAKVQAARPIMPQLLLTTFVSRVYALHAKLMTSSPVNPFEPSPVVFYMLCAWLLLQTCVVLLQQWLGPAFFFMPRYIPKGHDYHAPLPAHMQVHTGSTRPASQTRESSQEEVLNGASALFSGQEARRRSHSAKTWRKDIECGEDGGGSPGGSSVLPVQDSTTQHLRSPPPGNDAGPALDCVICQSAIDVVSPSMYMLTPCEHVFHTDCLREWMQHKMECPVCRSGLPEGA